jgi:hypothetical protein
MLCSPKVNKFRLINVLACFIPNDIRANTLANLEKSRNEEQILIDKIISLKFI